MYYPSLPPPFACGFIGAFAGLIGGGCGQCFPVYIGAVSGFSLGCALSILVCILPDRADTPNNAAQPTIVQNVYIVYDLTGNGKGTATVYPVATVAN
jgi:hypothetical protein